VTRADDARQPLGNAELHEQRLDTRMQSLPRMLACEQIALD
jgi:hypothetical protein